MPSIARIHREDGEAGHLGEFFIGLGVLILLGGLAVTVWLVGAPGSTGVDAATTGALFIIAGIGVIVFGSYGVVSGWGRHHPRFEHGGDPSVPDEYVRDV